MLGDVLGEFTGKRLVRRVLSTEPLKVEVSIEDSGKLLGVSAKGFGTYTSAARADGSIYGEGQGGMITQDGELVSWKGTGLGKIGADGSLSYRGMLFYQTTSQKLARLNTVGGAFEYEVDPAGASQLKIWEWK